MSVYFQYAGREVWNPSSAVARLFMQHVVALEHVVGAPAGLSDGNSDEVNIDAHALGAFLDAVGERVSRSNNRALLVLVTPATQLLCGLYARCEPDNPKGKGLPQDFFVQGCALTR